MIRYGLILLIICFCASLILSVTYKFTHLRIEAQQVSEEKGALDEVFPEATDFEDKAFEGRAYYLAKKEGKSLGYIIKTETKGYSAGIVMLVGFDFNGRIKGVEVLSQQETPGLGAKIVEIKQGEIRPWFLKQFAGKSASGLDLKDIQAITAATISSLAVLEGAKKSVSEFLEKIKNE